MAEAGTPSALERSREKTRRWHAANRDKINEGNRRRYRQNPQHGLAAAAIRRHGRGIDRWITDALRDQNGRCYLCQEPLPTDSRNVHVEHDHSCCGRGRSCKFCRRGLACSTCNLIIGWACDDPERLRRIAANLEPVLEITRARIAGKPAQETLL